MSFQMQEKSDNPEVDDKPEVNHTPEVTGGEVAHGKVPDTPPIIRLPCCPIPYSSIEVKPISPDAVHVITDTDRCRTLVARLQREKLVAVATEGINVGREGPLTLVQVGTCTGSVFIFDILQNRDLMIKGRLRVLLEDPNVVKVMHDVSNASAALHFQFATNLNNVFDTQVAHLIMEEHKGRRLPDRLSLSDLCLRYSDNTDSMCTYDWRTDSKLIWMAMVGKFWATRPLTPDMIEFASCDVIVLIPDVYRHHKEYIEKYRLGEKFRIEVEDWLQVEIDEVVRENRGKHIANVVEKILTEMDSKYDNRVTLFNILDPDEMNAIAIAAYDDAVKISEKILKLKEDHITADISDIQLRLRGEDQSWEKRPNILSHLQYYSSLPNDSIRKDSGAVMKEILDTILEHINKKYTVDTTPNMLSDTETDALLSISYVSMDTEPSNYGDVVVSLYWKAMQEEIHGFINMLRIFPGQFSFSKEDYRKLEYYVRDGSHVPEDVSGLAAGLLQAVGACSAANATYSASKRRSVKFRT